MRDLLNRDLMSLARTYLPTANHLFRPPTIQDFVGMSTKGAVAPGGIRDEGTFVFLSDA